MSKKAIAKIEREQQFFYSLLGALTGIGFIGLSVYLGAKDDFLASLLISGGGFPQCAAGLGIALIFFGGIALIGRHIICEDTSHGYYEQIPY